MDIYNKVIEIFIKYGCDISNDTSIYNMSSVDFISCIIEIEELFEIEIPDEYLNFSLFKVETLINIITAAVVR